MHRRARLRRLIAGAGCAALGVGGLTACTDPSPTPTVRDFLIAWQVGNYQAAAKLTTGAPRAAVASALSQVRAQLDAASLRLAIGARDSTGQARGVAIAKPASDRALARFSISIDLGENGEPWRYASSMELRQVKGDWRVVWKPSIINPRLGPGQRLAVVSEDPERASILDSSKRSLQKTVTADVFGVYPGRVGDARKTLDQLASAARKEGGMSLDVDRLLGRVQSAPPNTFLPLLTLVRPADNALILRLMRVPQLERRTSSEPIGAAAAPEVVGGLGPATSETLQLVGAPYQPGDTIGTSGIQLALQRRLAGIPTVRVVAQDPSGANTQTLASWPLTDSPANHPKDVQTTLNRNLQNRADNALAGVSAPASLIALRAGTNEVLAVANHGTDGRNLAMEGSYPPGMTFGIVTADALLHAGLTGATKTECPGNATVGNSTFTNKAHGRQTLERNFGAGCATTLASLSSHVSADALLQAAERYGFGKDWALGVPAFTGSVPRPADDAAKAAEMVGEGGVRMSPLAMATAAAGVLNVTWRPPFLLADPAATDAPPARPFDVATTADLQKLLRRGVVSGTARAANVSVGGKVSGVVATVDYQENGRTKTVSWFVGSRPDLAFAIAVEGKVNPAALAARFLTGAHVPSTTTKPATPETPGSTTTPVTPR
ncbi:penicillin-binding transpeptidase domain-containing protein [Actinomadura atramentaria]|uniref:penicillin-binding transpeptidase domain-containing protein n=1 Tax=Actinomadura atramentaria TaxID=1990 RepID=UPI00037D1C5D|nr:penicillin-binding transpeptidase domain-containing protein [Actinomadura atramentaria]